MATKINIQIDQGSLFDYDISIEKIKGNVVSSFTGYEGLGQIKKHYASNTAYDFVVTLTDDNINLVFYANTSALMEPGRYQYDVYLTSNNDPIRIVEGIVTLTPQITATD